MKNYLALIAIISLFAVGCQSDNQTVESDPVIVYTYQSGDGNSVATLDIDGMMCEMACGGKISKELRSVKGVASVDIDYADERDTNKAIVKYDPSKTNEQDLIKQVEQIADGKLYQVKRVEITTFKQSKTSEVNENRSTEKDRFNARSVFRFPDVFHLIQKLIR